MRAPNVAASLALAVALVAPAASLADPQPPAAPPPSFVPATSARTSLAPTGPQPGDAAPDFALQGLDGKTLHLADFHGKTLVINVWATWCPPCRQEMPDLIAAAPAYARTGEVAFLGVDTTETAPIVRAYAAAKGVSYPLAIDSGDAFGKAYDIQAFPTTYVIDAQGIVRARYIDVLAKKQLAELVAAGRAGKNASIVSPLQAKIDSTLAVPAIAFAATGSGAAETAAVAAQKAIADAEKLLDDSDAASGNSTDFERTKSEEAALRDRAIAALGSAGPAVENVTLLPLLRADAASDREQWSDALAGYRSVASADPKNEDALNGIALAAGRLKDDDAQIGAYRQLAALEPDDVAGLVDLALAQARAKQTDDAYTSFAKAVALGERHVEAGHGKAADVRRLAWTHLYFGRTYAKNGDDVHARVEFDRMLAWTQKLPAKDERHDMYLEEGQEAIAALGLGTPAGLSVSLAPWTGAELPGSIPNTIKYRLVLAGAAGRNVTLRAVDVPKTWVASFCSDKVCAPMRVAVAIPSSGVKIVEFQLVPPGAKEAPPKVRVTGTDGSANASAST